MVHEARNNMRLVACSVAAYSTEAQEVQEGLSKVRELQGTGGGPVRLVLWGHAGRSPASGQSCPGPSPSTLGWAGGL